MDVLEQGIKTNFSPSLKTFVLNLNGNAKTYPTSSHDVLFMLKYDKAYRDTSNSFKTQVVSQSDKNSKKNSKQTQLESNEVNLLKILLQKLQKYYAKYKIDVQSDEDRQPTLAQSLSAYLSNSQAQDCLQQIFSYMIKIYKPRQPKNNQTLCGKDSKKTFREQKRQAEYEKLAKDEKVQDQLNWKKICKNSKNQTINGVQTKQEQESEVEEALDIKLIEDPSNVLFYCFFNNTI
eukprot:403366867